jgi:hypothetical protein
MLTATEFLVLVGVARRGVVSGIAHIVLTIGIAVIGPLVHHNLAPAHQGACRRS